MRIVAVALALLSILALVPPTQAADECEATTPTHHVCVVIPLTKPAPPPPSPALPASPTWGTYYLYVGPAACASPTSNACRGIPAEDPGVAPPTGGEPVGVGAFGILWQESNGVGGLQRERFNLGGSRPADRMVLV